MANAAMAQVSKAAAAAKLSRDQAFACMHGRASNNLLLLTFITAVTATTTSVAFRNAQIESLKLNYFLLHPNVITTQTGIN